MLQTQIPTTYSNSIWGNRQALLVQQNASVEDTGLLVNRVLQQRGYDVATVSPDACTKQNVLASIDSLVTGSKPDSRTLFYYTGHGFYDNGATTILDSHPRGFRPQELFQALGQIRGRKAVFLDACLSGEFVDYLAANAGKIIRNYVVLAATSRDGLSLTAKWTIPPNTPHSSPLNGNISNLAYWLFAQHRDYGTVYLDKWSIDELVFNPQEVAQKLTQGLPWKIRLEIQRTSDAPFDL